MPASGVLRSHESSTYPRWYASGSCFACGLADRHFEHPARGYLPIHQTDKIDQTDPPGLYGVTTFNLNKAVKRNSDRFPEDFMFRLSTQETAALTFQI